MSRNTFKVLLCLVTAAVSVHAQAAAYAQCGGIGWTGATTCVSGSTCVALRYRSFVAQCVPGIVSSTTSTPTASSSAPSSSGSCVPNSPPSTAGQLKFTGVNIAGFDFGCSSDGTCNASGAYPPLTQYYGADGAGQMQHFVNDDGFNTFRLPVSWQFLTNDILTGVINEDNFTEYDALVQACLDAGAYCIIDVHNYARWNGEIIGQGGPSDDMFASIWASIAAKYADNSKIIFGVMNEPHDVPDINLWAGSVQAAVTAIRNAGATTQYILLPGNNWTSAATFISNGSADALNKVVNPDGTKDLLVFDVHKYLDYDNSGTNSECVTNNIADAWEPLTQWLRCNGRQAFNTETGGGNVASCAQYMCEQVAYQKANSDVILGYVGWAAGNFYQGYVLSEVPTGQSGGTWTDTLLVSSCLAPSANIAPSAEA
ncbi:endoglucanase [Punctularia strigosozonata HHB-11173 SS5]|uniref:endoglucanase n=1 Tax=Punctularia strigosozonata (strain HHB-11173) TaxID=741275 RepID=UPI0004418542|nr:endoglucanase [Punctularia strigosozonata HHB-11173 SS5]EIN08978.1 endoglucanase [Punctularia strigosozonata HHB-11173 SS5]